MNENVQNYPSKVVLTHHNNSKFRWAQGRDLPELSQLDYEYGQGWDTQYFREILKEYNAVCKIMHSHSVQENYDNPIIGFVVFKVVGKTVHVLNVTGMCYDGDIYKALMAHLINLNDNKMNSIVVEVPETNLTFLNALKELEVFNAKLIRDKDEDTVQMTYIREVVPQWCQEKLCEMVP